MSGCRHGVCVQIDIREYKYPSQLPQLYFWEIYSSKFFSLAPWLPSLSLSPHRQTFPFSFSHKQTHTHTHTNARTRMQGHTKMHTHIDTHLYTGTHTDTGTNTHKHTLAFISACYFPSQLPVFLRLGIKKAPVSR